MQRTARQGIFSNVDKVNFLSPNVEDVEAEPSSEINEISVVKGVCLLKFFFPLTKLYFIPSSAFNASRARFYSRSHLQLIFEPQVFLPSDFPSCCF